MGRKVVLLGVKIGMPIAILAYLIWEANQNDGFSCLLQQSKDWPLLGWAVVCFGGAVVVTLVRWYFLARALEIELTLNDALRFGLLGYLFNLAPLGIVGGDLLKAYLLARHSAGRRASAVASVMVDRLVGLYALFVVASAAILVTGFGRGGDVAVRTICLFAHAMTLTGTVGIVALLLWKWSTDGPSRMAGKIPWVGGLVGRVIDAAAMYRGRKAALLGAVALSAVVHGLISVSIYLVCGALYRSAPSLTAHFVVSPLSNATGVIPVVAGPFELVLNFLYAQVGNADGSAAAPSQGLMVALAFRIVTIVVAAVGLGYCLAARSEAAEVFQAVEDLRTTGETAIVAE